MRVVHAAALTAVALVLASVASAQGLGDAAARERNKRKAEPAKPARVYTEGDIGRSMAPVVPDLPVTAEGEEAAPAEGQPPAEGLPAQPVAEGEAAPEGEAAVAGQAPPAEGAAAPVSKADADRAKAEEEARAKAEADWRKRLEQARKEAAVYQDVIDKLQAELNDISGGLYNPSRAAKMSFQEENKVLLAQAQGRIATLEEEGRRNNYR
jgi:hypothetical protein